MAEGDHRHPAVDQPNAARVYDYDLGGDHHFAVDRNFAARLYTIAPHSPWVAQSNRAFLTRAVRYCLNQGINQFLDLGSGIPTVGNVHEIAHQHDRGARVSYVDNDPVAVAQTRRLLAQTSEADIVDADLRAPEDVLASEPVRRLLRFDQPIALLMVAALHYVDTDPVDVLTRYTRALPTGSTLAVSHVTADGREDEAERVRQAFDDTTTPITLRTYADITALIDATGWRLISPGLVRPPHWRPDPAEHTGGTPTQSGSWAGVATNRS